MKCYNFVVKPVIRNWGNSGDWFACSPALLCLCVGDVDVRFCNVPVQITVSFFGVLEPEARCGRDLLYSDGALKRGFVMF